MSRYKPRAEIRIIRENRRFLEKVIVRLFPHQINAIFSRHIGRAYEVREINSKQLHSLCCYIGADCGLPGYGGTEAKE